MTKLDNENQLCSYFLRQRQGKMREAQQVGAAFIVSKCTVRKNYSLVVEKNFACSFLDFSN